MICQIINHKAMNIKFRSDYPLIVMNWPHTTDCGRESREYYVPIKIYQHTKWVEIREREREREENIHLLPICKHCTGGEPGLGGHFITSSNLVK